MSETILFLDLGNTKLKWLLLKNPQSKIDSKESLKPSLKLASLLFGAESWKLQRSRKTLLKSIRQHPAPSLVLVAKTAKNHWSQPFLRELKIYFPKVKIQEVNTLEDARSLGFVHAYHEPKTLGVDRFLNLLAAKDMDQSPLMLVNCGTAWVLDFLLPHGVHEGGFILPSPVLSRAVLQERTPLLLKGTIPDKLLSENPAKSTKEAFWNGIILLWVQWILFEYQKFSKRAREHSVKIDSCYTQPKILLSGGGASMLHSWLLNSSLRKHQILLEEHLLFIGMWSYLHSL